MKKIQRSSKFILFFIVIIFASVLSLFYLSISNISNYRDLLESKVAEEERNITAEFATFIDLKLDSLSTNLPILLDNIGPVESATLDSHNNSNGIIDYVLLDINGSFLKPFIASTHRSIFNYTFNKAFDKLWSSGQLKEFREKDYGHAKSQYFKALAKASVKQDSVRVFNALSRLSSQTNDFESLINYCDKIVLDFGEIISSSGFPYAYYAVYRILKLDEKLYRDQKKRFIIEFLEGLSKNDIPMNVNTNELLDSILFWSNSLEGNDRLGINQLIEVVNKHLSLYEEYKMISDLIRNSDDNQALIEDSLGSFSFIQPNSDNFKEVLLLFRKDLSYVGFILNVQSLAEGFNSEKESIFHKFEYSHKIVQRTERNFLSNTNTVRMSEFSPVFKKAFFEIGLKSDNIIEKEVLKRKFSFATGMLIFLGILILAFYLMIKDINRENKLNKLRTEFVSQVTHELKTPLTSINMFAEALHIEKDKLDDRQLKYSRIIVKESEKLKHMINNILDFSKKENESLEYRLEIENLAIIINETISNLDYFFEINKMEVEAEMNDPVYAMINAEAIKQALTNLLNNAIKYSAESKKIIIRLFEERDMSVIEIEDFGIGIPIDKIDLVFEKFYRIRSVFNDSISGTGLGLTVTKAIVESHNGEIKVESLSGKGSKFSIFLPGVGKDG